MTTLTAKQVEDRMTAEVRPMRSLIRRLLFPMVLEPCGEDLLRHREVREAIHKLADGEESQSVTINGRAWRVERR